jgi:ubiquinone/menaquinone biosynthesis methyltransferases
MANEYYRQDEQRASRVNELFARIAGRYDLINDLQSFGLHRVWKQRVVRMARVSAGDNALDLCCGTGDIALALHAAGAKVVGLDFTQEMLNVAERRAAPMQGKRRDELSFIRGDAQSIPFPENSFDIVTVGYGLRNLASWEQGLREMLRVAKPGGRLVVLEFGKPDNGFLRWCYFTYLRLFVPVLGWLFCGNASAYGYILESLKHYPAQRGVAAKMKELGLGNIRIVNLLFGVMSINYGEKAPA